MQAIQASPLQDSLEALAMAQDAAQYVLGGTPEDAKNATKLRHLRRAASCITNAIAALEEARNLPTYNVLFSSE